MSVTSYKSSVADYLQPALGQSECFNQVRGQFEVSQADLSIDTVVW